MWMYENGGFWKRVTSWCWIPVHVHASIKDGSFFQSGRFQPYGRAKTDAVFLATEKKIVIFKKKKTDMCGREMKLGTKWFQPSLNVSFLCFYKNQTRLKPFLPKISFWATKFITDKWISKREKICIRSGTSCLIIGWQYPSDKSLSSG